MSPYANSGMTWDERLEAAAVLLRDAVEELLAAERDETTEAPRTLPWRA